MSEDEDRRKLERLRAVRGGHRGVVTKLCREAEAILLEEPFADDPIKVSRLTVINEQLDTKRKALSNLDGEIVSVCPLTEIETELTESEPLEAKLLETRRKISAAVTSGGGETRSSPRPVVCDSPAINKPRLPKLTLPKFRGDVTQWSTFWDSYKSAVHENPDLPSIDKFNYLKSLLEGTAARTIQGLTLKEGNYANAIQLLEERYGKPQHIISAHMEELIQLPACTGDKPSALRYVFDKINVNLRGLDSMGIKSEQYGSLLIPIVMTKLPPEIRLRIARETDKEVWEIEELIAVIKKEVEAREATECVKLSHSPVVKSSNTHRNSPPIHTASALTSSGFSIKCAYCKGPHYSASCMKFRTASERKSILIRAGKCFNCLKPNHKSHECESTRTCRFCNRKHHQSLCERGVPLGPRPANRATVGSQSNRLDERPDSNGPSNDDQRDITINAASNAKNHKTVLLQTAHAIALAGPSGPSVPVRILFDGGSQLSYVTERLQQQLYLKPTKFERLHLNTFGHDSYKTQECAVVTLYLRGHQQAEIIKVSALTSPSICTPLPSTVRLDCYPHLQDLPLADVCDKPRRVVDVLIGSNYYWNFVTGAVVKSSEGPVAVESKLGWLLSGPIDSREVNLSTACLAINGVPNSPKYDDQDGALVKSLREFWEVESLGIAPPTVESLNSTQFPPRISFKDNRYSVSLPWRLDHPEVHSHLSMCEGRLKSLLRKLQGSPEVLLEYDKIIKEQLRSGIIETVEPEVVQEAVGASDIHPFHYLPHHGVVRQSSQTTKLRIVYDGSARGLGDHYSLNDCLEPGPNCIPKLFNILVQFRWHRVAVTADIEKAFLMVGIDPPDREVLRFLWAKDPFKQPYELVHLRFTRLVFGLRPSPAILGSVLTHHIDKYSSQYPEVAKKLRDCFYVDDLITGAPDADTALEFCIQSRLILERAGMNLRKWNSNAPDLLLKLQAARAAPQSASTSVRNFSEDDETYAKTMSGHSVFEPSGDLARILGIVWDSGRDVFSFDFTEMIKLTAAKEVTKRSILRLTAKLFDPLGFVSPFVIQLKILFQDLCVVGVDWDAPLSDEVLLKWRKITSDVGLLNKVAVPRCYFKFDSGRLTTQLHGFCDASERAFAAVVYVRSAYSDGSIEISLLASKTRVAPTKQQTIPRLELLGALVLSRLVDSIIASLPHPVPVFYWTDSMAALHWIRVIKPWKQYISHRVTEIRRLTMREQWQHCPGDINPADLPSRGLSSEKLASSKMWWKGPEFLRLSHDQWPRAEAFPPSEITEAEVLKNPKEITLVLLTAGGFGSSRIDEIIDCTRYSRLNVLLRVTGFVLKFTNLLLRKGRREETVQMHSDECLTGEELNAAEAYWVCSIQAQSFADELRYLRSSHAETRTPPVRVAQFGLFVDDRQQLRCRGRINNSLVSCASKNPILLPSSHPWVTLLVRQVHQDIKHSGTADTLSTIRENYWILKGRQSVKKILRSCVVCNKLEGVSYSSVSPPDLPSERTSEDPPFSHTGIDFAGPLFTKGDGDLEKAYVCLFTCTSTRAVHLELAPDLSVSSFLLLFRRFVGRRGLPVTIFSDNAKTFKTSSKHILKIARSSEVIRFLGDKRVTWKFIVERAPWWGGFWERLIQSVKRSLRKSIGRSNLTYEQLSTLIVEVESIINSRPLTYIFDDREGITGCLTPSHLLNGRRICTMPNSAHFEVVSTYQSLTSKLRHHRHLLDQFVKRWRRDYLLNLRENHSLKAKSGGRDLIQVGDVVVLKDDSSKRIFWRLAIVNELLKGNDNLVRAAIVKLVDSRGSHKLLRRSIRHLYPIEVNNNQVSTLPNQDDILPSSPTQGQDSVAEASSDSPPEIDSRETATATGRPRRQAAIVGEQIRRDFYYK